MKNEKGRIGKNMEGDSCGLFEDTIVILSAHVERKGEKRNIYKILVVKLKGKRPLGRPRST
jgi:hypothetical protein